MADDRNNPNDQDKGGKDNKDKTLEKDNQKEKKDKDSVEKKDKDSKDKKDQKEEKDTASSETKAKEPEVVAEETTEENAKEADQMPEEVAEEQTEEVAPESPEDSQGVAGSAVIEEETNEGEEAVPYSIPPESAKSVEDLGLDEGQDYISDANKDSGDENSEDNGAEDKEPGDEESEDEASDDEESGDEESDDESFFSGESFDEEPSLGNANFSQEKSYNPNEDTEEEYMPSNEEEYKPSSQDEDHDIEYKPSVKDSQEFGSSPMSGGTESVVSFLKNQKAVLAIVGVILLYIVISLFAGDGSDDIGVIIQDDQHHSMPMEEPSITLAPTSPSSSNKDGKPVSLFSSIDDMANESDKTAEDMERFKSQIASLNRQNVDLRNRMDKLDTSIADLTKVVEKTNTQISALVKTQEQESKKEKKEVLYEYRIRAVISGRAWLEDGQGNNITVKVGDNLPTYGRITKIKPVEGIIETSSGRTITFSSNE